MNERIKTYETKMTKTMDNLDGELLRSSRTCKSTCS